MTPRVYEALLEQRKAFIDKFGREPSADDPVFFDPDKSVPTQIDPDRFNAQAPSKASPRALICSGLYMESVKSWWVYRSWHLYPLILAFMDFYPKLFLRKPKQRSRWAALALA
jgi:hypothetical protein